jgi:hypothetical protein
MLSKPLAQLAPRLLADFDKPKGRILIHIDDAHEVIRIIYHKPRHGEYSLIVGPSRRPEHGPDEYAVAFGDTFFGSLTDVENFTRNMLRALLGKEWRDAE